jgi:enamine deaminase RidA (YjgF/YER057c/UK114 family)
MLGERDKKLQSLGFPLDRVPAVGAIYKPVVIDGTTVYTSGNVPMDGDKLVGFGKVPTQVSLEDGKKHAALCAANILRHVIRAVGSLDRIERVIRTVGYVNCEPTFNDQHLVINGASELMRDVFGDDYGIGVRTAIGMAGLPLGSSVEVDVVFKLKA